MARFSPLKVLAVGALAAAGLGLAGCGAGSPILTTKSYAASDGVRAQLSENLRAENLMLLTSGPGSQATLYGALVNNSDSPATFTIAVGQLPELTIEVGPGEVVNLPKKGTDSTRGDYLPGTTVAGAVTTALTGSQSIQVPVLDGTIPPYNDLIAGK